MRSLFGMLRRRAVAETVWCECGAARHQIVVRYGQPTVERKFTLDATRAHEIMDEIERVQREEPDSTGVVQFRDVFQITQIIRAHELKSFVLLPEKKDSDAG